jgi:hypothetical protein
LKWHASILVYQHATRKRCDEISSHSTRLRNHLATSDDLTVTCRAWADQADDSQGLLLGPGGTSLTPTDTLVNENYTDAKAGSSPAGWITPGPRVGVPRPPTGQNYAIGCRETPQVNRCQTSPRPAGHIEGTNRPGLVPPSLYEAQLTNRLSGG